MQSPTGESFVLCMVCKKDLDNGSAVTVAYKSEEAAKVYGPLHGWEYISKEEAAELLKKENFLYGICMPHYQKLRQN